MSSKDTQSDISKSNYNVQSFQLKATLDKIFNNFFSASVTESTWYGLLESFKLLKGDQPVQVGAVSEFKTKTGMTVTQKVTRVAGNYLI